MRVGGAGPHSGLGAERILLAGAVALKTTSSAASVSASHGRVERTQPPPGSLAGSGHRNIFPTEWRGAHTANHLPLLLFERKEWVWLAAKGAAIKMTAADKVKGLVDQAIEEAEPLVDKVLEKAESLAEEANEKAELLVVKVKEKAEPLLEKVKEKAEPLLEKARDRSGKASTS